MEHGLNTDGRIVNQDEPVRPQSRQCPNSEFVMAQSFSRPIRSVFHPWLTMLDHGVWPLVRGNGPTGSVIDPEIGQAQSTTSSE